MLKKLKEAASSLPTAVQQDLKTVGPKIQLPTFPVPVPEQKFLDYCHKTGAQFYMNGSVAWACPPQEAKADTPESRKLDLPKGLHITEDAMLYIFSALQPKAFPNVATRLLSGFDLKFVQKNELENSHIMTLLREFLGSAYYLLNPTNPIILFNAKDAQHNSNCASVQRSIDPKEYSYCFSNNMQFEAVDRNSSNAPPWVQSTKDWDYWKLATLKLYDELGRAVPPTNYPAQFGEKVRQNISRMNLSIESLHSEALTFFESRPAGFGLFYAPDSDRINIVPGKDSPNEKIPQPAPTAAPNGK